jgi:hypothetical protein
MVNEQLYAKAWKRRHDINERAFYAFLHTKLNAETKRYLKSQELKNPKTFHITSHFSEKWMMEILKEAYWKFGKKQFVFLNGYNKKEDIDPNDENAWSIYLLLFFSNIENFYIILGIIRSIKNDIKRFVEDKIERGVPASAILTMLGLYLIQNNIIRASTIARTEITRIMNQSSIVWANNNGKVLTKKWLVILDGKERPSHNAMADYPSIPLGEKFLVGGSLMNAPGDSSAPPQEVVNCRCAIMFM